MKMFLLLTIILLLAGCHVIKTYDEINYKKLSSMFKNKDSFILFIGSDECSLCNSYEVTLNRVIDRYNTDIKYINLSKLSRQERRNFASLIPINEVPVLVFITEGEEKHSYSRINGNVKYSKIIEKLKENNYIKE